MVLGILQYVFVMPPVFHGDRCVMYQFTKLLGLLRGSMPKTVDSGIYVVDVDGGGILVKQ